MAYKKGLIESFFVFDDSEIPGQLNEHGVV